MLARSMPTDRKAFRPSIIGLNVRRLRTARGLSQDELAAKSGWGSRVYIARIETGAVQTPSLETQQRLADALEVPLAELAKPAHGVSPIAPLVEGFRESDLARAIGATEEELAYLLRLGDLKWLEVEPTFTTLVNLIKARRGEL